MKKRKHLLQRVFCMLLSASLLLPYVPAHATDEATELQVTEEAEEEITWPEPAEDWYLDYEHEFVNNEAAGRYELHLTEYKPREEHASDKILVVPGRTAYSTAIGQESGLPANEDGFVTVLGSVGENKGIWSSKEIDALKILDGARCGESATGVFSYTNLKTLDLSGLDTSETKYMKNMFCRSNLLKTLDLSELDTSNVTDMCGMFKQMSVLESIRFGEKFDTSNVTTMAYMFAECYKLQTPDLSGFNTAKVTSMSYMFEACSSFTQINFGSGFDTSGVTLFHNMFNSCTGLTSLDVSSFNTSKAERMSFMFGNCTALKSLTLGEHFDTGNVTGVGLYDTFINCKSLETLDVSSITLTPDIGLYEIFKGCESLTELDLSSWNMSNVRQLSGAFEDCRHLERIIMPEGTENTRLVDIKNCFKNCEELRAVDLSGFTLEKVTDLEAVFSGCYSLESMDLSHFNTANVTTIKNLFYGCHSLKYLDMRNFDFRKISGQYCPFGRSGIVDLYLPEAAMKDYAFASEANLGTETTAGPLARIYYEGSEEQWETLNNTLGKNPATKKELELICGYKDPVQPAETVYVENLDFRRIGKNKMDPGQTMSLELIYTPRIAHNMHLEWSSSKPEVASVDKYGLISAHKAGNTTIKAVALGAKPGTNVFSEYEITVNGGGDDPGPGPGPDPDPEEPKAEVIIGTGEATDPQPTIDENTTKLYLVEGQQFYIGKGWSSSGSRVLSVSKKGMAKAKKTGTVTLSFGEKRSIEAEILPFAITEKVSLQAGYMEQLVLNCDSEHLKVRWISNAPDVATIDDELWVHAHSKGTAKITAIVNGVSRSCKVTVSEPVYEKEHILHLNVGKTKNVKIRGMKKTEWTVLEEETEDENESSEEIVQVIKGSKVKALKAGKVTLVCGDYKLNVIAEDPSIEALKGTKKPYTLSVTLNLTDHKVSEKIGLTAVEQDVYFKSSKSSVAYMDAEGVIHARSKGKAKLSAKVNGRTISISVTVK